MRIALIAAMLALAGCGAVPPAVLAGLGGASTLGSVVAVAATASTVLSDSAQIGCAVQKVANDLGAASPSGSATAAAISHYAGLACAW